jgi:hypothetical protein
MAVAPLRKNSTRPPEVAIGGAWNIARLEAEQEQEQEQEQEMKIQT